MPVSYTHLDVYKRQVHFSQVDYCEVPHILAFASLLHAGPTIHDGPPYIPADFVAAIRALDVQGAQEALNNLVTYGPAESLFSQDCISGRWLSLIHICSMAQAGKSGTTTSSRDALFAGYTPYYTCAVWGLSLIHI